MLAMFINGILWKRFGNLYEGREGEREEIGTSSRI
jgi:hypothetical protein